MHETLIKYINNHSSTPLTETEIEMIKETLSRIRSRAVRK